MPDSKSILEANILIVDDEPANCALLEAILASAGYRHVTTCDDPQRVHALHREHRYDLILLDLEMPGMGGFEVMHGLRDLEDGSYLPVIVITGHTSSKLPSLKAGARDFVGKPFDVEEVLLRIHNTLEVRLAHQDALSTSQQMQTLALHDPLTGLANRRLLEDRVRMALRHARRDRARGHAALLYLDLDGFKQVNDTLGHHAGDLLLQQVAQRLSEAVRGDDTVARLGGDEFVLVLAQAGEEDAGRVAQKIIDAVAQPYELEGTPAQIGVSVGIGVYPAHGKDADSLMHAADAALYRAKEAGKGVYRLARPGERRSAETETPAEKAAEPRPAPANDRREEHRGSESRPRQGGDSNHFRAANGRH
ncbi:MAG TPA: diguanylate cyclase [Burkholderiales bacterium]